MSRLNFKVGDQVVLNRLGVTSIQRVMRVEPALGVPYFLSDNEWYEDDDLTTYVEPDPSWEQVEAHVKHIVEELRTKFADNDESGMLFEIIAGGRPDGDIKITYKVADSEYGSGKVTGYSLRPTLDEFFRRKTWKQRNEPLALTHDGDE